MIDEVLRGVIHRTEKHVVETKCPFCGNEEKLEVGR